MATKNPCKVCGKLTYSSRCGKVCCSACNSYYRRNSKQLIPQCTDDRSHKILQNSRYQKCLEAGIRKKLPIDFMENLVEQDRIRKVIFENSYAKNGKRLLLEDILFKNFNSYTQRLGKIRLSNWIAVSQLTSIDFLSNLYFYQQLVPSDQIQFIKATRFRFFFLSLAMKCYEEGKRQLEYPDGSDIFPNNILRRSPFIEAEHLQKIRTTLIEKLAELKIKQEEFLMLMVLLSCTTALALSDHISIIGKSIIEDAKTEISSLLMKHSEQQYGIAVRIRYVELLSVQSVVDWTHKSMDNVQCLYALKRTDNKKLEGYLYKFE